MGKKLLKNCLWVVLVACGVAACDTDPTYYGDGYDSELNSVYSNKTYPQPGSGNLNITYSGNAKTEKDVYFEMSTKNTAKMVFFNTIPGFERSYAEGLNLTEIPGGYLIAGSATATNGTTYKVSGVVKKGQLSVDIYDVSLGLSFFNATRYNSLPYSKSGPVTIDGKEVVRLSTPFGLDWKVDRDGRSEALLGDATDKINGLLGKLFYLILPTVEFYPDGSLAATYAPLSEDVNILELMDEGNVTAGMRAPSKTIYVDFLNYSIDKGTMYLKPDINAIIDMIDLGSLLGDNTRAGDGEGQSNLSSILEIVIDLFPNVQKWMNQGIPLRLVENDEQALIDLYGYAGQPLYTFAGEYYAYLDREVMDVIFELVPTVLDLMGLDLEELLEGLDLEELLGFPLDLSDILNNLSNTTDIKLGVYLDSRIN